VPVQCPQCGEPNDDDNHYCVQCGLHIDAEASASRGRLVPAEDDIVDRLRAERARTVAFAGMVLIGLVAALVIPQRAPQKPVGGGVVPADRPATPPTAPLDTQPASSVQSAPRAMHPAPTPERAQRIAPTVPNAARTARTSASPRRQARAKAPRSEQPSAMPVASAPLRDRRPVARTLIGKMPRYSAGSPVDTRFRPVIEAP
jgi:hypothetical protein